MLLEVASLEMVPEGLALGFATLQEDRVDEFRLRRDVYVGERKYIARTDDEHTERDAFDTAAVATLVRDADTGALVACQRIIIPELLPVGCVAPASAWAANLTGARWAELSRYIVAPSWRTRGAIGASHVLAALRYGMTAAALAADRTHLVGLTDPSAIRFTRRQGVTMTQLGPAIEWMGKVVPFSMAVPSLLASIEDVPLLNEATADARRALADLAPAREAQAS